MLNLAQAGKENGPR